MECDIGLGTWAFGRDYWQDQHEQDSIRTIHRAVREGITFFDTAQAYGRGTSEQVLGQQLRRFRHTHPRTDLTIDTKVMLNARTDAAQIHRNVHKSLRRLCVSYIDTCYIHWPRSGFDYTPVMEELARLKEQQVIRHIGISNVPPELAETLINSWPIDDYQGAYSLLWRQPEERLMPLCANKQVRFTAYGILAQGILGDAVFPPTDSRRSLIFSQPPAADALAPLIADYRSTCRRFGITPAQAALRWALGRGIDRIIIGARTPQQLSGLLDQCRSPLQDDLLEALEQYSLQFNALLPRDQDNIFSHRW